MLKRKFPKVGDRINCDPNRDEGDVPHRWRNPNRASAKVVAVFNDDVHGACFVYRISNRRRTLAVMTALDWDCLTMWAIGPLTREPPEVDLFT